jgi:hypothetical protein
MWATLQQKNFAKTCDKNGKCPLIVKNKSVAFVFYYRA